MVFGVMNISLNWVVMGFLFERFGQFFIFRDFSKGSSNVFRKVFRVSLFDFIIMNESLFVIGSKGCRLNGIVVISFSFFDYFRYCMNGSDFGVGVFEGLVFKNVVRLG